MLKILITEDEVKTREGLASQLQGLLGEEGLIETAADGNVAVTKALQMRPNLILMDIEMPHKTGLEAAAIIKQQLPQTRLVFLTAYDRFDYAVGAMRSGGEDYILKPVATHELAELLQRLFGPLPSDSAPPESPFSTALSVWIRHHYREDVTLEQAAESMGMSSFYFSRQVKASTGKTFLEYLTGYRIEQAKNRLHNTELTVSEVGRAVGYPDANYFVKVFKRTIGLTPSVYRSQQGQY